MEVYPNLDYGLCMVTIVHTLMIPSCINQYCHCKPHTLSVSVKNLLVTLSGGHPHVFCCFQLELCVLN